MAWYDDYNRFFEIFVSKAEIADETSFYFTDDENEEEHMIGFIAKYEKPYWIGGCDVKDGCDFSTADELFHAKVFDGRSIYDRWDKIVFVNFGGIDVNDWILDESNQLKIKPW